MLGKALHSLFHTYTHARAHTHTHTELPGTCPVATPMRAYIDTQAGAVPLYHANIVASVSSLHWEKCPIIYLSTRSLVKVCK